MECSAEMNQVKKKIDDFQLGPIDLDIQSGLITALVGSNGAGKSTVLKMLMNLVKQDEGTITLLNEQVDGDSEEWKEKVAYLPQSFPGLVPFTGMELKKLTSEWYPKWDERLFNKINKLFDLSLTKKFGKLSQGSQQKLKFALTLPRNPNLLILDEPTSHMDIPSKKLLIDLLVEWMEEGARTILLATHQVEDIRKLADYLVIMDKGRMLGSFEKEELIAQYKQYWVKGSLPPVTVPGEIERKENMLVTKCPSQTEEFLKNRGVTWSTAKSLELDEIISIMLTK
ncbi:ABC transporter ATP-binding protein [Pueribacillus theae]|uniref:ABC transporter ATP-binding protein n=1 Tax=Pueribacillus theae TaxID=2171751 RepID=A0A2U1JRU4_9BACI|nr:ABC transporter ATP-binding protein [Pueribacillus theae]PWA07926.1 ABC transporter ATP-binding protein [Pueribacillus theae]